MWLALAVGAAAAQETPAAEGPAAAPAAEGDTSGEADGADEGEGTGEGEDEGGEAEDAPAPAPEDPPLDDTLSPYRTPFGVLAERAIGTTSRPVAFNWRRTNVHLAAMGNHYFELNNINSLRAGGMVRLPSDGLIYELGLSRVWVWDTPSSQLLSLTPYRQPGRAQRLELDFTVALPVAEGLVTTAPRYVPAVELVFNVYAGLRYLLYPQGFGGMKAGAIAGALLSPTLTEAEIDNLDASRLRAMQVDGGRYGLMVGFGNDLYLRQGVFVSPRLMLAVPLLSVASETELLFWADLSLSIGVAL